MRIGSHKTDIAIIGHLAKDLIEIDGKITSSIGGGVYYGALAGYQMNLDISIITRLNESDFPLLYLFKQKGIKVFAETAKQTSGIHNIYSSRNMEFRSYIPLGFAGTFRKSEIPQIKPKFFAIGAIVAGEIDSDLFNYLASKFHEKLCVDIQGFIRFRSKSNLYYRDLDEISKSEILSKTFLLKLDQTELNVLTGLNNIKQGALELKKYGPQEILITHEDGISILTKDGFETFPWHNHSSEGRTGRGDTAFISYLGSRITKSPIESLKFSAALTSLKMESPGAFSLPIETVLEFMKKKYSLEL